MFNAAVTHFLSLLVYLQTSSVRPTLHQKYPFDRRCTDSTLSQHMNQVVFSDLPNVTHQDTKRHFYGLTYL